MYEPNGQIRAKFKRLPFVIGWTVLMILLAAFFSFVWVEQNGFLDASIFAVIAFLFILGYGGMLITGASDIVLSDKGVSRQLFGITWKEIHWSNISKVVVFFIPNFRAKSLQKAYNVFPHNKPVIRLLPSGKIAFIGNAKNMNLLLEGMNHYLSRYNIRIELVSSGITRVIDRL
ncbi:MAG TPA: hypothetical protein VN725_09940 [Rhodanobacteraceae bacterium]|nr:hypothetical protein [Rhodanobacteraceae bacterium]